jgi:hypothetical protein
LTISLIFLIFLLVFDLPEKYTVPIGLGWLLALIHIVLGFIMYLRALRLKNKSFGKMITISIFSRLIFTLISITIIIKFINLNTTTFIFTLFSFYFVFQIIELVGLNKISKGSLV